jgi:hypothetical protein
MHAKYAHELCSLLMHIPTYYNVISCYNHDLWGFSIDLPYFDYNSAEQENLFCVFLGFRNLPELKLTWDFSGVNILSRRQRGRPHGPLEIGWHGPQAWSCHHVSIEARAFEAIHLCLLMLSLT